MSVLVDPNMQVACNIREGGGLRSVSISQLNNEELRCL